MQLNGPLTLILSPSDGERRTLPRRQYRSSFNKSIRRVILILFSPFEVAQIKLRRRFD